MEAEVLFEYEPTQDDELALKVGVIIKNVKEVDDGWCEGDLNGKRGMFPDNFVKLRPATRPAAAPSQPPPVSEAPVPLRNIDAGKKIRRAKVTFSYAADNSDELSLAPGQVVEVLEEEEEGWWKGRIGNMEGVFPSNFVEEIVEEPPQPSHPPVNHHQPVHQPSPEAVDSQTGERGAPAGGEAEGFKSSGVRGPKVMPAFDPTKARAGLKKASVAPPLEKPPEHKKVPPPASQNQSAKHPVEQAKVVFDYDADNDDELTIKVGEVVDIISKDVDQDGWWEVSLRGRKGLVPDNFLELLPLPAHPVSQPPPPSKDELPPKQPTKPPPPKESHPPPPFAAKKPETKKFLPKQESGEDQADFPVPKTTPLNSQVIKERPKTKNRPPSRSNLLANHEPLTENPPEEPSSTSVSSSTATDPAPPALSPWQAELKAKKKPPKLVPKPAVKPGKPPVSAPSPSRRLKLVDQGSVDQDSPQLRSRLGSKDVEVSKPDPPPMARSRVNTDTKPDPPPMARSRVNTGSKDVQPPPAHKATSVTKPVHVVKPAQPKPVETKPPPPQDTPTQSEPSSSPTAAATSPKIGPSPTVVPDNSWKEAYEKLKEDFEKFKEHMVKEIAILTDDLDKERKHRAAMDIDIDRLKKAQRSGH